MNFHFIRLIASLGFEARYLIVSEIAVYPANRLTDNAVLRFAAMTCGIAPHRTGEASSPSTVPRIQCDLFSIDQCPRRPVSKRSADAAAGLDLLYHSELCVFLLLCSDFCPSNDIGSLVLSLASPDTH